MTCNVIIAIGKFDKAIDKTKYVWYNGKVIGVWLSPVECLVRDQEAAGSNPVTPMIKTLVIFSDSESFLFFQYRLHRNLSVIKWNDGLSGFFIFALI